MRPTSLLLDSVWDFFTVAAGDGGREERRASSVGRFVVREVVDGRVVDLFMHALGTSAASSSEAADTAASASTTSKMHAVLPAFSRVLRRLRRSLGYDGAFTVDFSSRGAAQAIFEEGSGSLLTDGTRACMETSHLAYGATLSNGEVGLRLTMDGSGMTCGKGSEIAVGHLASWKAYTYGDFEWRARIHHAPDGGRPPSNSFTCFSTFIHGTQVHNELAWCFPANDGTEVHMSYWYDDGMHRKAIRLKTDLTKGVHSYATRWREVGIDWLIDGQLVHSVRGTPLVRSVFLSLIHI